jgi:hypothetical protein
MFHAATVEESNDSSEAVKKSNQGNLSASRFRNAQPKTRAERAFHLGGAGAPAHAFRRRDLTFNFFTAPLLGGARARQALGWVVE